MLFEAIVLSQLFEANTRNRAIDRTERGTFWDDLDDFADEVSRQVELKKQRKKNGLPKYDRPTGQWVNVETGEVIDYER